MGYKVVMSQEEANELLDKSTYLDKLEGLVSHHIHHICEMQKEDLQFVLNYLLSAVRSGLIDQEQAESMINDLYSKGDSQ